MEIKAIINLLNDIHISQDFCRKYEKEYKRFAEKEWGDDARIPFSENDELKELHNTLICKLWDSFLLYLKNLILAAEAEKETFSKNLVKDIDGNSLKKLKIKLHDLRICPQTQPQWDELDQLKDVRNTLTHNHALGYYIKAFKFNEKEYIENMKKITPQYIDDASKYIINFARKIDEEFLKNYPAFIRFENQ